MLSYDIVKAINEEDILRFLLLTENMEEDVLNTVHDETLGLTMVGYAVYMNLYGILNVLIQRNADLNSVDDIGDTPLITACKEKDMLAVELLIEAGAKVNKPDPSGYTPLHWSVLMSRVSFEIVEFLVKHGADPHAKANNGKTPMILATEALNNECIGVLINMNKKGDTL